MTDKPTYEELEHRVKELEKGYVERKRIEERLEEKEQTLQVLLNAPPETAMLVDLEGTLLAINEVAAKRFGKKIDELIGKGMHDRMPYDLAVSRKAQAEKVARSGKPVRFQDEREGRIYDTNIYPVFDAKGKVTTLAIYARDITETKRAEEALRESEEKYRTVLENIEDGYYEVDIAGNLTFFNDSLCRIYGYSKNELMGMGYKQYTDKENGKKVFKLFNSVYRTGEPAKAFDWVFIKKDKTIINVETSVSLMKDDDGNPIGFRGIVRDITERKQAEESLRESESRYRSLFESANDAIFIIKDDEFMDCNRKALEMFGCTREQIIGKPPYTFSPIDQPDGSVSQEKAFEKIKAAYEGEPQIFEWRHTKYDGTLFDAQVGLNLVELSTGIHLQAMVRDITEKKSLDKQIQLMQHWVEQSVDLFFWVREDSQILYVNQAVCYFLGYTKEEFRTMKVSDFDLDVTLEAWPEFSQTLREQGSHCFETRLRKKNGQVSPVEITANILNFEGKDHFFAFGRDISAKVSAEEKRKELENQLHQAQKMEAIGTMAGGIAHDFNNILGGIIGYTELAQSQISEDQPAIARDLSAVLEASDRAKELVQQILTFSRQTDQEFKPVKMSLIVKEAFKLLRASLPTTIEITLNIKSDATIWGEATQLHQTIMNLCVNAGHAMRAKGGLLDVNLVKVELDFDYADIPPDLKPGPYLKLTVSDTGHGMHPEVLERIFDPFYTTKEKGEGTGMGLAVVHGIAKSHGGTITVYSELEKGSVFNVFLPVIEEQLELEKRLDKPIPKGTECILFIDDEEILVDVGKRMLESLGYDVVARTSGIEALELFKAQSDKFDLVITDLTMPKMTGDKLAVELLRIKPDMPIILCTGFSAMIDEEKVKAMGLRAFVLKPILKRDIAETIRKVFRNVNRKLTPHDNRILTPS